MKKHKEIYIVTVIDIEFGILFQKAFSHSIQALEYANKENIKNEITFYYGIDVSKDMDTNVSILTITTILDAIQEPKE